MKTLWLAAGREGTVADFLKGIIHLAAAGVKHQEEMPGGVQDHAHRAAELWQAVGKSVGAGLFLGFQLQDLIDMAEKVGEEWWPETPPTLWPQFKHG